MTPAEKDLAHGCMRHVQTILEHQRLLGTEGPLDGLMSALVSAVRADDVEQIRERSWEVVQAAERMPRGRYEWKRPAAAAAN